MTQTEEMKRRTRSFALRIIKLVDALPQRRDADIIGRQLIGRQLIRCGTSVGANYHAACRARSRAEFVAKLGIVEEETDESIYWMDLLVESGLMNLKRIEDLRDEADQLVSIFISSIKTARARKRESREK